MIELGRPIDYFYAEKSSDGTKLTSLPVQQAYGLGQIRNGPEVLSARAPTFRGTTVTGHWEQADAKENYYNILKYPNMAGIGGHW